MTAHRALNMALLVFGVVAWAFAMDTDFSDGQQAMDAERRAWAQAVAHCHRAFTP